MKKLYLVPFLTLCLFTFQLKAAEKSEKKYSVHAYGYSSELVSPAPRADRGIHYENVSFEQNMLKKRSQTDGNSNEIVYSFSKGRTLLGRVEVVLSPLVADSDSLKLALVFYDASTDQEKSLDLSSFNDNGYINTEFEGVYASEVTVVVSGVPDDQSNPIQDMNLYEIVLSDRYRIMLLGDSITAGALATDYKGYRHMLYDRLRANNVEVDFVGDFGEAPYEGHFEGGRKIYDFYPQSIGGRARADATWAMNTFRPQMVVIHLGTNDLGDGVNNIIPYDNEEGFSTSVSGRMATLVDYLLDWTTDDGGLEKIVVNLITPIKVSRDSAMNLYTMEVARLVRDFKTGAITGKPEPVYISDVYSHLRGHPDLWSDAWNKLLGDALHPTTRGHQFLTDALYPIVEELVTGQKRKFSNATWDLGIGGLDHLFDFKGVAVADVTDHYGDDIYISRVTGNSDFSEDLFFESKANIPFKENADDYNIEDKKFSQSAIFVDVDNDGDFDLLNGHSPGQNYLYKQSADHTFTNVTSQANIQNYNRYSKALLAFDCENDGDMDLLVINSREQNEFYINQGDGTFELENRGILETNESSITTESASAADFDMDGDVDVYIAKREVANKLFVNDGSGNFTEKASLAGVNLVHKSNGVVWADLDNDADLDLLVSVNDFGSDSNPKLHVYKNQGDGTFQDVTSSVNIPMNAFSPIVADFDNDSDLDIVTTDEVDYGSYYENLGNWQFQKVENTGAEIFGGDVRGASVLDFNQDGNLDFVAARSDVFNIAIENNNDNGNNYIKVSAYGPDGNIGGFGTKIWIFEPGSLGDFQHLLGFREIMSTTGYLSQSSPVQHFGLAGFSQVDILAGFTDGTFLAKRHVNANQTITIEPEVPVLPNLIPDNISLLSGNNISGTVTQQSSEPIVVSVQDADNQPVPGMNVEFEIVSGDAQIITPLNSSQNIWVECESTELSGNMRWVYDAGCSGGGFVMLPKFLGGTGAVQSSVSLSSAGNYSAWMRIKNVSDGSFIKIQIDNQSEKTIDLSSNGDWQWLNASVSGQRLFWNLQSGIHSVKITTNNVNLQIDKLLITSDDAYVPDGLGTEAGILPHLSDRDGLSKRYIQFGQQAGPVVIEAVLEYNGASVNGSPVQFDARSLADKASTIVKQSGDMQIGIIGEPLTDPLVVAAVDGFQNPVFNKRINFSVVSGGGTLNPDGFVFTDSTGLAQTYYTPGDMNSAQVIKAEADSVTGSPLTFNVMVQGIASKLTYVSGDSQETKVMTVLPAPVRVKIVTDENEPVVNYPVQFNVTDPGAGLLEQLPAQNKKIAGVSIDNVQSENDTNLVVPTDSQGIAEIYWQLGQYSGEQHINIVADLLNGSPMSLKAVALASDPALLMPISGNQQQAVINTELENPFKVRLLDEYGNSVPDYDIKFESKQGGGLLSGENSITLPSDENGEAFAVLTLGTLAGKNAYLVEVSAVLDQTVVPGSPVQFYATGLPGQAKYAAILNGNAQSDTVNQTLPIPLQVKITDEYENVVPGFDVVFRINQGDGRLGSVQEKTVATGENGVAQVLWTLGVKVGTNNAYALCDGLIPNSLFFTAKGKTGIPFKQIYIDGNDQSGLQDIQLSIPFQVQVTDSFENPVKNHQVLYTLKEGGGNFNGESDIYALTDSIGVARASLTLGSTIGDSNHVVWAQSSFNEKELENSPIVFYASVIHGIPHRLIPVSVVSGLSGAVNSELPDPIVVKVVGQENQPIPVFPVVFQVTGGGGHFAENDQASLTVLTDYDGLASARWVLGNESLQNISVNAVYQQQNLIGSPLQINAVAIVTQAKSIVASSEINLTGKAGQPLSAPLAVRTDDEFGFPVSGHPVTFRIEQGSSYFTESSGSVLNVNSDNQGLAQAELTLGGEVGENTQIVHAKAYDQTNQLLTGAPIIFSITVEPGLPDVENTQVSAFSPVPAQEDVFSTVTITVIDSFGNKIPDQQIELLAEGLLVVFDPQNGTTDQNGIFTSNVTSTQPGEVQISARDVASQQIFTQKATIQFMETLASAVQIMGSQNRLVNLNSSTGDPISVQVVNSENAPVANYPVFFTAQSDSVSIPGTMPLFTDEQGVAQTNIFAGEKTGKALVNATAPGLQNSPLTFSVTIQQPENVSISTVGDGVFTGAVNTHLDSLEIKTHDQDGRAVGQISVTFQNLNTLSLALDSTGVVTNAYGKAKTSARLKEIAGQAQVIAKINGTSEQTLILVNVLPDAPEEILKISGDQQTGSVGDTMDIPLKIKVVDQFGNSVSQIPVSFSVLQGDGEIIGDVDQVTEESGTAFVQYKCGNTPGTHQIKVESTAFEHDETIFTVNVVSANASKMAKHDGDEQVGVVNHLLNQQLQVLVTDDFDNPVADYEVSFNASQGTLTPGSQILTDENGIAAVQWKLGEETGQQYVYVVNYALQPAYLTFSATAIENQAPRISAPDSVSVNEKELLQFVVTATDPENDTVTVRAVDLPQGVSFDSLETGTVTWTPDYDQAGVYYFRFIATDQTGAFITKNVKVNVANVNRKPVIVEDETIPEDRNLPALQIPETKRFYVAANDDDGDPLQYIWNVNGTLSGTGPEFILQSQLMQTGNTLVTAVVFDQQDSVKTTWQFDIVTSVELSYFSGNHQPFQGIQLKWETRSERNNSGFYILRSVNADGDFESISPLISSNSSGKYEFVDQQVENGVCYYYCLQDVQLNGKKNTHETVMIDPAVPHDFALFQNYPNPFNPSTTIRFQVPKTVRVSLQIYNILGQHVKTLSDKIYKAGYFSLEWDGTNNFEQKIVSGVYYLKMDADTFQGTQKLLLLK